VRTDVNTASGHAPGCFEPAKVVAHTERGPALLDPTHVDLGEIQIHLMQRFFEQNVATNEDVNVAGGERMSVDYLLQSMAGGEAITCATRTRLPVLYPQGFVLGRNSVDVCGVC